MDVLLVIELLSLDHLDVRIGSEEVEDVDLLDDSLRVFHELVGLPSSSDLGRERRVHGWRSERFVVWAEHRPISSPVWGEDDRVGWRDRHLPLQIWHDVLSHSRPIVVPKPAVIILKRQLLNELQLLVVVIR